MQFLYRLSLYYDEKKYKKNKTCYLCLHDHRQMKILAKASYILKLHYNYYYHYYTSTQYYFYSFYATTITITTSSSFRTNTTTTTATIATHMHARLTCTHLYHCRICSNYPTCMQDSSSILHGLSTPRTFYGCQYNFDPLYLLTNIQNISEISRDNSRLKVAAAWLSRQSG